MADDSIQDTTPKRVREFAQFFKNYMSLSSVVTAALPIPVTLLGLVPTYSSQKGYLSVWTSLFCFLLLGFTFFCRNGLALHMFPDIVLSHRRVSDKEHLTVRETASFLAALPLVLIGLSLFSVFWYHSTLTQSVHLAQAQIVARSQEATVDSTTFLGRRTFEQWNMAEDFLRQYDRDKIPAREAILADKDSTNYYETGLTALYLIIFLSADAAFLLMAMREYIQDLLKVSDVDLILGRTMRPSQSQTSTSPKPPTRGQPREASKP